MKSIHLILTFLILLLAQRSSLSAAEPAKPGKPAHLLILSGQSNMQRMDPRLGFEPEAQKAFPDAEVAYVKVAIGGQPIRYWVDEWNDIAARHGIDVTKARAKDKGKETTAFIYPQIVEQFGELLKQHPNPASVTFCWMQGERDAKENLHTCYADAFKQLIANLRRDLKLPEMNIVIGRLSDHDKAEPAPWQAMRETQVQLSQAFPHGAWVDCDDLNDKEIKGVMIHDLHYTRPGYELLGRRFVRQARALITGQKPAENGRPD